jgi:hypothetical protein
VYFNRPVMPFPTYNAQFECVSIMQFWGLKTQITSICCPRRHPSSFRGRIWAKDCWLWSRTIGERVLLLCCLMENRKPPECLWGEQYQGPEEQH